MGGFFVDKCEDFNAIDLAWLNREGITKNNRRGEPYASVGLNASSDGIRLQYRARQRGEDAWQSIDEFISYTTTRTNFGGRRKWFQCPSCKEACRILYGGMFYRCRRCHDLKYESQYEPSFVGYMAQAEKIRKKLRGTSSIDDPFPEKPKGMHWQAYWALEEKYYNYLDYWACSLRGNIKG